MPELFRKRSAILNFGAAKLTVTGEVSVEELEAAGAFDGLQSLLTKGKKVVC